MVERLEVSNPSPINTLAIFRLHSKEYAVLFDDTANDNLDYIEQQILVKAPGRRGEVLLNPKTETSTYGLPYEGKDCYLYQFVSLKRRLDTILAERYPDTSRSSWQKHIKAGRVLVEGEVRMVPKLEITSQTNLEVNLPMAPDYGGKSLPIIYQDDDVTVFDKPIDVLTHPKNPLDHEFTVMDMAKRFWTDKATDERYGIVHRLDRDTSGVIIVARNLNSLKYLKQQFSNREVSKTYQAIVNGHPKQTEAVLDLPILRNSAKPGSFMVNSRGKSATTVMKTLKIAQKYTFIELYPKTGRTHQLRVHMNYINCPIHGDRLYGKSADRLYLHACRLELKLPSGETKTFISSLPAAFTSLMPEIKD